MADVTTQAPPATTSQPPPSSTAAAPPSWTDGLGDELKGYVQTKGFADPKAVVESYKNVEKLLGAPKERLLTLPESLEGEEAHAIWERLGAPKEAKEYSIDIPKEHGDEKMAEWAKEAFHKLKVPRPMAENFVKAFNERQLSMIKEQTEAMQAQINQEHDSLKREWGSAFEQNTNIANQAAQKFGLKADQVKALGAALGPSGALKFLHKLGEGTGEASFVSGNGNVNAIPTPDQAKFQIKQLISDADFQRRLQGGESDAKNKWDRLHQFASPGQISI